MDRQRIKLEVYVDLDPIHGTFHTPESARNYVEAIITDRIPHYAPTVLIPKNEE